jgi:hypothetical protein
VSGEPEHKCNSSAWLRVADSGFAFTSPGKLYPTDPDFLGRAQVDGRLYQVRGYVTSRPDGSQFIDLRFFAMRRARRRG